jgi:hypothetical protein
MLLQVKTADTHPKPHTKLFPIFVPSKTALNGDIPVTPIGRDGRRDDVGPDPAWNKKSGKLYWVCLSSVLMKYADGIARIGYRSRAQQKGRREMASIPPRKTPFPSKR